MITELHTSLIFKRTAQINSKLPAIVFLLFIANPDAGAQDPCAPLKDNHTLTVEVSPGGNLADVVGNAASGTTILLKDGVYKIQSSVYFNKNNVTLRSKSGERDKVVLDGNGGGTPLKRGNFANEILKISASHITVSDLTIRYARDHGIHAYGRSTGDIEHVTLHNIRVLDCGQQIIKINSNGGNPAHWVDKGTLSCSTVEFVDNSVMDDQGSYFYTGGIDVHGGRDWLIRHNIFRNIQREGKLMEHAVHFWSRSRGTVVENNRFENVYRAIGFGMKEKARDFVRSYPDKAGEEPYFDHVDGIIRNNIVHNTAAVKLESGIELSNVTGAQVYHNTVYSASQPFNSIEYRWPNTRVVIKNNIFSHKIMARDGAKAEAAANLENAPAALFVDAAKGDFRLKASATQAIGKGVALGGDLAGTDLLGFVRSGQIDIGAYAYGTGPSFLKSGRSAIRPDNTASVFLQGSGVVFRTGWNDRPELRIYHANGKAAHPAMM